MSASEVAIIRLVSIGKRYAGTSALDDVSLAINAGSVHALVGANGAGKSTLGKIIGGVVRADDGEMFVDGRAVKYSTPREARGDGIATIAQELALAPAMSVMENVFLGIEPRRAGHVVRREMRNRYAELISDERLRARARRDRRVAAHRRPAEGRDPARRQQRRAAIIVHGRADLVADERRDRGSSTR